MAMYVVRTRAKTLALTSILLFGDLMPKAVAVSPNSSACIVAFGDSTTFGYSVPESYPQKLARRLFDHGMLATVVNSGVNGDTTAGARARFERDVLAHSPDVVVIQFGLNDQTIRLYEKPERIDSYVSEEQFIANLRYFTSELQQRGIQVVLMTPNPMCWTPTLERHYPEGPFLEGPRGGNLLLRRYVIAEQQLAVAEEVPLVHVFGEYDRYETTTGGPVTKLFLEDGVHPNEIGYDLNVRLLWEELLPLVRTETPGSTRKVMKPISVIRDGKPLSAYVVGWGCRRRDGYTELARTEHERNPRDCLWTPTPAGEEDWAAHLEFTALERSEWAIQLGESGRIAFSTVNGKIAVDGPLFQDSAMELFGKDHVVTPGAISLELHREGRMLRLRIEGRNVGAAEVGSADIGPVGISPSSGAIRVKNFRML